jgi:hypothetical protein
MIGRGAFKSSLRKLRDSKRLTILPRLKVEAAPFLTDTQPTLFLALFRSRE